MALFCAAFRRDSIIIVSSHKFFIQALADGLLQEFQWKQVTWCLQDYSQYSGRS